MARRRMIDPSIWDDEGVGSLSDGAFRLFIAIISNADDDGKLEASPRRLKGIAFAFSDKVTISRVEKYVMEIESAIRGFVCYQVADRQYIKLLNWHAYQTINRPSSSKLPEPPTNLATIHGNSTSDSVNDHGIVHDHSLLREEKRREENLSEDSLTDHSLMDDSLPSDVAPIAEPDNSDDPLVKLYTLYQSQIRPALEEQARCGIAKAFGMYGFEDVARAIDKAASRGFTRWKETQWEMSNIADSRSKASHGRHKAGKTVILNDREYIQIGDKYYFEDGGKRYEYHPEYDNCE